MAGQKKLTYNRTQDGHYQCQYCGIVEKNQNTMHYHLKKHAGLLPHKCKHCDKGFLQKKQLDLHVEAKHPQKLVSVETYECPSCDYVGKQKGNLYTHFMRVHCKDLCVFSKTESGIECGKCETVFANSTSYYYHTFTCVKPTVEHIHYSEYMDLVEMGGDIAMLMSGLGV